MKVNCSLDSLAALILALAAVSGCRQAPEGDPQDKLPITGKPSDPAIALKAEWRPGYRYLVFAQTEQTSSGSFRRGPVSMESTLAQDLAVTVSEAQRGNRSLEVKFQSLMVTMSFGEQVALFFDSQNSVTTPIGNGVEALEGLIGKHVTVQLRRDGIVGGVDGVRELLDKVSSGDAGRRSGLGMLQRYLGPWYFRQILELGGLPTNAVKVGESWSARRDLVGNMGGMLVMNTTNTFIGWQERQKRQCVRIAIKGGITLPASQNRQMGGDMTLTDGQVKGTLWLDPKLEFPVELALEENYTITGPQTGRGPQRGGTNAPAGEKFARPVHQALLLKLTEAQPGVTALAP